MTEDPYQSTFAMALVTALSYLLCLVIVPLDLIVFHKGLWIAFTAVAAICTMCNIGLYVEDREREVAQRNSRMHEH